jgi:hypothetical protein
VIQSLASQAKTTLSIKKKKRKKELNSMAARLQVTNNKKIPHKDLPHFLTQQIHEKFTLLRMAAV